ncbi:hypothetical protein C0991_007372 [Blastosporella zonata]|nr:hypothetical protein C0991_007372 [Blastosporella zonata]
MAQFPICIKTAAQQRQIFTTKAEVSMLDHTLEGNGTNTGSDIAGFWNAKLKDSGVDFERMNTARALKWSSSADVEKKWLYLLETQGEPVQNEGETNSLTGETSRDSKEGRHSNIKKTYLRVFILAWGPR